VPHLSVEFKKAALPSSENEEIPAKASTRYPLHHAIKGIRIQVLFPQSPEIRRLKNCKIGCYFSKVSRYFGTLRANSHEKS
jgi:hypothetical protein